MTGTRLKVVVDFSLCEANAVCESVAPAVFRIDSNEQLELLAERPPPEQHERVREAARRCPRAAITLVEEP